MVNSTRRQDKAGKLMTGIRNVSTSRCLPSSILFVSTYRKKNICSTNFDGGGIALLPAKRMAARANTYATNHTDIVWGHPIDPIDGDY